MTAAELISLVKAAAVPSVAFLGVVIASTQAAVAWQKLKLDLFEKRFVVFEAYRTLIGEIIRKGAADEKDTYNFAVHLVQAELLFGDEVVNFLEGIHDTSIELKICRDNVREPGNPDRKQYAEQSKMLMHWIIAQDVHAKKLFKPYIKLDHSDIRFRRHSEYAEPPLIYMKRTAKTSSKLNPLRVALGRRHRGR